MQGSTFCTNLRASLQGLWESPTSVQLLSTLTTANHLQCAQSILQPPAHSGPSQRSLRKKTPQTLRDTHDSRGPSHVFLKYIAPDIRLLFFPFATPLLKCIPIRAFSSEHQASKLLFQAKKSLKEVTPQRTGSAHFLRGSYCVEYPPETKCSHPVSHFFWHQSCFSG